MSAHMCGKDLVTPIYEQAELKMALGTAELRAPLVINKQKSPEKENDFLEVAPP